MSKMRQIKTTFCHYYKYVFALTTATKSIHMSHDKNTVSPYTISNYLQQNFPLLSFFQYITFLKHFTLCSIN
jgi:hypothetical protein